MRPISFRYLDFDSPLFDPVEWGGVHALLIFNTESGRNAARRLIQEHWGLTRLRLLTMEEFKDALFSAPAPLLKEEKRTLAFFSCLDPQAREFFHISSYFQSVELANQFFSLCDECAEAGVELADGAQKLAAAGLELLPWQENSLAELLRIRALYREWISVRGFADRIFTRAEEYLDFSFCREFSDVVLVNFSHATALEKGVLRGLAAIDVAVTVLIQMPAHLVDEQQLALRSFAAAELTCPARQRIIIRECPNEAAMYLRFAAIAGPQQIGRVVDVTAQPVRLHHLLSPARFRLPASTAMSESSLYHFFATLEGLLAELLWDSRAGRLLLPLPALLHALNQPGFYRPLLDLADPLQSERRREEAVTALHELQEADYLYLDLEGRFLQNYRRRGRDLEALLRPVLRLLVAALAADRPHLFGELIDAPAGIPVRRILSAQESRSTNLLELFYQLLADFIAIESLDLITDWRTLLPGESRTAAPRAILRLFLDYIKSRRYRFEWNVAREGQVEFSSLAEAGDQTHSRLALLRVNEGELPRARRIPWLFSDIQRDLLGLESAEVIRQRERQAFFRLVLATPEICIYTIKNISENIEPSSFVEELRLAFPDHVEFAHLEEIDYRDLGRQFFRHSAGRPLPVAVRDQADFFIMPFAAADFPEGKWRLSFTAWQQLKIDGFHYFINHVARIPEWPPEWPAALGPRLLGKLAQAVFDLCWTQFNKDALPFSTFDRIFARYGEMAITSLLDADADFYFKLPKNHELDYFQHFVLPVIRDSSAFFYRQLHERFHLDRGLVRVFPDAEFTSAREQTPRLYIPASASGLPLDLYLSGRADLRIEFGEPLEAFLIDYKTGKKPDEEQLRFYELVYYLIDQPEMIDKVTSCFYRILHSTFTDLESRSKRAKRRDRFIRLREEIIARLTEVAADGYQPAARRGWGQDDLPDIVRMEIYHPR